MNENNILEFFAAWKAEEFNSDEESLIWLSAGKFSMLQAQLLHITFTKWVNDPMPDHGGI